MDPCFLKNPGWCDLWLSPAREGIAKEVKAWEGNLTNTTLSQDTGKV